MTELRAREKALFLDPRRAGGSACDGYDRIYVGAEFCERLLPSVAKLETVLSRSTKASLPLTLVTPYLTSAGMSRLSVLLRFLSRRGPEAMEVVCNDWGTLHLLGTRYRGRFQPVLGRLLMGRWIWSHDGPPDAFLDFIRGRGISRLEFNCYRHLECMGPRLARQGMRGHLYWPYAFLATTRFCLLGGESGGHFRQSIDSCKRQCLHRSGALVIRRPPGARLRISGNTLFIRDTTLPQKGLVEVDRLVDIRHYGMPRHDY